MDRAAMPRFTIHEGSVLRWTDLPTGGAKVNVWTGSAWAPGSLGDFSSGVRATADDLRRPRYLARRLTHHLRTSPSALGRCPGTTLPNK